MAFLGLVLILFTICFQLYCMSALGKNFFNERVETEMIRDITTYLPFKAQLQYASVTRLNNGMFQYVIKVLNAENTECSFHFPYPEEATSVNDVMIKDDTITGILLMERGPSRIMFICTSPKGPMLSQYLFARDMPSNVTSQMELRDNNGCKISEPVFSSDTDDFIIEIQATCSFALTQDNAMLSVDLEVLRDREISYYINEDSMNTTRSYENGIAKTRFTISNDIPSSTTYVPWFSLQLKTIGNEKPLFLHKYNVMSDKALDGTSPVIPKGTVAISVHLLDSDTNYIKRESNARLICEAYGNPIPIIEWRKNGQLIEGESNQASPRSDMNPNYKILTIESMDSSKEAEYSCNARVLGNTVTKSINIKVCDPATVHFSTSEDENNVRIKCINATLSAIHDDSNMINDAYCYKGRRATLDARIQGYDSSVSIIRTKTDTTWEETYSWNTADRGDVPKEMYCEIRSNCATYPIIFNLKVGGKVRSKREKITASFSLKPEQSLLPF